MTKEKTQEEQVKAQFDSHSDTIILLVKERSATRQQVPTIKKGVSGVNVGKTQLKYNGPLW